MLSQGPQNWPGQLPGHSSGGNALTATPLPQHPTQQFAAAPPLHQHASRAPHGSGPYAQVGEGFLGESVGPAGLGGYPGLEALPRPPAQQHARDPFEAMYGVQGNDSWPAGASQGDSWPSHGAGGGSSSSSQTTWNTVHSAMLAEQLRQQMAAQQQLQAAALLPQAPPHFGGGHVVHPQQYAVIPQYPVGLPGVPSGPGVSGINPFQPQAPQLLAPLYADVTLPAQDRQRVADQLRAHLRMQRSQQQQAQQHQQHAQLQQQAALEAQMQFEQQMLLEQQAAEVAGFQAAQMMSCGGGGVGGSFVPQGGIAPWPGEGGQAWSVESTITGQASGRVHEQMRQQLLQQEQLSQQQMQGLYSDPTDPVLAVQHQQTPAGPSRFGPLAVMPQHYASGQDAPHEVRKPHR